MTREPDSLNREDRALAEASAWRIRLSEDASLEPDFEIWLAEGPENVEAWRKVMSAWRLFGDHEASPAVVALRRDALAHAERTSRRLGRFQPARWRMTAAALLCAVAVSGAAAGGYYWLQTQPVVQTTDRGERRSMLLADGSRVSLDSSSDVRIRYTDDARTLELKKGQARFDVAHDPQRPFSVRAGSQTVIAIGTAFNVELVDGKVFVTLIEGRVTVVDDDAPAPPVSPQAPPRIEHVLEAGQQLAAAPAVAPIIRDADVARVVAWERGQLDFDDETLGDVVARVNRYTTRRIVVRDAEIASLRVSGVVDTTDVFGLIDLVTSYLPVDAAPARNGVIELRARKL